MNQDPLGVPGDLIWKQGSNEVRARRTAAMPLHATWPHTALLGARLRLMHARSPPSANTNMRLLLLPACASAFFVLPLRCTLPDPAPMRQGVRAQEYEGPACTSH